MAKLWSESEFERHTLDLEDTLMATVQQRIPEVGMQVVVVSLMAVATAIMRAAVNAYPEARPSLLDVVADMREDLLSDVPLCPDCGNPMIAEHGSTH